MTALHDHDVVVALAYYVFAQLASQTLSEQARLPTPSIFNRVPVQIFHFTSSIFILVIVTEFMLSLDSFRLSKFKTQSSFFEIKF